MVLENLRSFPLLHGRIANCHYTAKIITNDSKSITIVNPFNGDFTVTVSDINSLFFIFVSIKFIVNRYLNSILTH